MKAPKIIHIQVFARILSGSGVFDSSFKNNTTNNTCRTLKIVNWTDLIS